jgi:hypothetical protein
MWVAVPDNYEEDDAPDDFLDGPMCINDIRMGEFLNDDSETDDDDDTTKNVGDVYLGNLITEEDMIRNQAGVVVSTSLSTATRRKNGLSHSGHVEGTTPRPTSHHKNQYNTT